MWSGDTVVADEEGFLYFVGRTDEMIKTSGYRVSPTEIEEAAYETGLVRDAVALGVPDERLGPPGRPRGLPHPGASVDPAALLAALRTELPLFMVPAEVVVRDELPRSPNGKFDRVGLAHEIAQELADDRRTGTSDQFGPSTAASSWSAGSPLERLAARVGSTPFFAYDRARISARVAELRAALPDDLDLGYAVKANPMPAVVQHLAGLVDTLDVASAGEMAVALDTGSPRGPGHLRRAGQDRPTSCVGPSPPVCSSRWSRRARSRRLVAVGAELGTRAARRRPGQPRLRGQGVGHAHGRWPAAVRRRRRGGARR